MTAVSSSLTNLHGLLTEHFNLDELRARGGV